MSDVNPTGNEPVNCTVATMPERGRAAAAWDRFVTLFAPIVYHWCRRAGLPPAEAAEVGHQTFAALSADRDGSAGDGLRDRLASLTRDVARSRQSGAGRAFDTSTDTHETVLLARGVLAQIRPDFDAADWQAFWSTAVEGRSVRESAAALGRTAADVAGARARVLLRLRRELASLLVP